MRVFDTYCFNIIDKVSFKDTKPYLEQMLREQGFSYKNISFMLYNVVKEKTEKVISKFPSLKKYEFEDHSCGIHDYGVTSIRENWKNGEVHADKSDLEDISVLFSKIPRPYNFSFGKLILDGVKWFADSDESVAISNWDNSELFPMEHTPPFISNRIMQYRFYDDGKKYNNICITIEVTGKDTIMDSVPIIQKLEPYTGKFYAFGRECVFDKEEYFKNKNLIEKHSEKIKELGDSFMPESNFGKQLLRQAVTHVADKFILNKVFKGTRFERIKGQPYLCHLYSYVDNNGYKYDAYIQKISTGNEFRCWLGISGYNFYINYSHEDYVAYKEGESLEILKVFARFCDKMIDEYSEELKNDFGITPEWYYK